MRTVPLHGAKANGRFALVDDDDYELVAQHSWTVLEKVRPGRNNVGPYARTGIYTDSGGPFTLLMHKLITGWPETDHRDHNGLNNQRSNLREVTRDQNCRNAIAALGKSSAFKGVDFFRPQGKWRARIGVNYRSISLGYYGTEIEAALAYDAAARELFGEFAYLNFP